MLVVVIVVRLESELASRLDIRQQVVDEKCRRRFDPKLPLRPARLYVTSSVPADVSIDDGLVEGRALNVIQVPILGRRMEEKRRISVTAQGYEPYTGTVHLTAGQLQKVNVDLEPSVPH